MPLGPGVPRFLQLTDVAEILNISTTQAYALVRRNELKAIKIGGRGVWRVEAPSWRRTSSGSTPTPRPSSTATPSESFPEDAS